MVVVGSFIVVMSSPMCLKTSSTLPTVAPAQIIAKLVSMVPFWSHLGLDCLQDTNGNIEIEGVVQWTGIQFLSVPP